mmetsp:Transcript_3957/g.11007  ORF Transcript_3957/g.11007 Transcript_3957/m.11007 type:complete len:174 (-) Transcript_3957:90-611(-)
MSLGVVPLVVFVALASAEQVESAFGGGWVKIKWSDCGDASTHGRVRSVTPHEVQMGKSTAVRISSTVDEGFAGGQFTYAATAGSLTETKTADLCTHQTLPIRDDFGSVTWQGFDCPVPAGDVHSEIDVSLSEYFPWVLAYSTIDMYATATSGDKLFCVRIHTAPEMWEKVLIE